MEFIIEKLQGKYHISSCGGDIGNPYRFHKQWGIPYETVVSIFYEHNSTYYDGLLCFENEDDANATLIMLNLLRCNYDRRT